MEFPKRFLGLYRLTVCKTIGRVAYEMDVVLARLKHQKLIHILQLQRTLVPVENLLEDVSEEVLDDLEVPEPDIVEFVSKNEAIRLNLLLYLVCCFETTPLQKVDQHLTICFHIDQDRFDVHSL
jgi:hypothetical protein